MIHVIATISLAEGQRERFLKALHKNILRVQAEDGCIEYGSAVDIDAGLEVQKPVRDNVVTVVEKWESLDALMAHLSAPHMLEYRKRVGGLVVGVELQVLEPA